MSIETDTRESEQPQVWVTTFYCFVPLPGTRVSELKSELETRAESGGVNGLVLLGAEGVNATVAGPHPAIEAMQGWLRAQPEFAEMPFKDSYCSDQPFKRFKVDLRDEIVTLKRPDLLPGEGKNNHLSPSEWHAALTSGEDLLVIDTRNRYETKLGVFRNAVDPGIDEFSEFPDWVKSQKIDPDRKVLMYCTGGIRCEKAILAMQEQGFRNVYQLDGGILNYLAQYPEGEFTGECFVFDHRVAVDGYLRPSAKYTLCPHCGDPADKEVTCGRCGASSRVCERCADVAPRRACSKNCAHHLERGSRIRSAPKAVRRRDSSKDQEPRPGRSLT